MRGIIITGNHGGTFIDTEGGRMNNKGHLLEKWKACLGLTDWHIVLKADVIPSDMSLDNVAGETEWTESNKCAVIRILSEKCYGDRIVPFNFEKTLIHELLHLKFCLLGESGNDLQDRYVHQLIDDLARALYNASKEEKE